MKEEHNRTRCDRVAKVCIPDLFEIFYQIGYNLAKQAVQMRDL